MKIAILGGGNMGAAYYKSFILKNIAKKEDITIYEKKEEQIELLKKTEVFSIKQNLGKEIKDFDVLILAVKPQDFSDLASEIKVYLSESQIIISIMAGVKLEKITSFLPLKNIIRAMPNTPAQLGKGITVFTTFSASKTAIETAETLLAATGKAIFTKEENQIDAVTAVSGSGPAYFYFIVKNMIDAGIEMGLDAEMASLLVKQTLIGSYHLMEASDKSLDELIKNVKSKGGTTEAALNVFSNESLDVIIKKGMKAAKKRSEELSKM